MEPPADIVARLRAAGCVFAQDEARLLVEAAADDPAVLAGLVGRRVAGEPLEPLLGWVAFAGLRLVVGPGVFVPRRRTELLAGRAASLASPGAVVLDLCCGAGAVGAVVLDRVPGVEVHAADLDAAAVRCARRNLPAERVWHGNLFAALPAELRGCVDVVAANAPYVPTDQIALMPPEARDFEPHLALNGGPDGVDVHRRVAAEAPGWLSPGGHLLIETGRRQAPSTAAAMIAVGFDVETVHDDEVGGTVVIGRLADGTDR